MVVSIPDDSRTGMTGAERRAVSVLGLVYAIRMLGLFLLLPVLALFADTLPGATPFLVGLAVGAYGLTQALLQIPFGVASDRLGRKPIIITGLVLFALGSVLAAVSDTITGVVLGRALQGAGAVSAAITAYVADVTSDRMRTRAMAIIGASIGLSFVVSLVLGPVLATQVGVPGIFWLTAALATTAAFAVAFAIPGGWTARASSLAGNASSTSKLRADLVLVLKSRPLLTLDASIFLLHLLLTACFVALPFLLRDSAGIVLGEQWKLYIAVILASVPGTVLLILFVERHTAGYLGTPLAVGLLTLSFASLYLAHSSPYTVGAGLVLFFAAFNFLEARLPALIARFAPDERRGAALGVYASAQFSGAFAGGVVGGTLLGLAGAAGVLAACATGAAVWTVFTAQIYRMNAEFRT